MSHQVASLIGRFGSVPFLAGKSLSPGDVIASYLWFDSHMAGDLPSVAVNSYADRWVSCYGNPDDDKSQSESFEIVCDLIR